MPFFSASDLRVSSAAKELVMPTPIRAAQSAMPEKGNLVLIITPFISLIQAPVYKIIKKRAGRCKLTETKSSDFLRAKLRISCKFAEFRDFFVQVKPRDGLFQSPCLGKNFLGEGACGG